MLLKKIFSVFSLLAGFASYAQDTTESAILRNLDAEARLQMNVKQPVLVFHSQKLINAKTVEVLKKGILDFNVTHNFGDIAGDNGGIKNFFGLDNAADVKIGFQLGLTDRLNILFARTRGSGAIIRFYELGIKNQFMQQGRNNQPLSVTGFANVVVCSQTANPNPGFEGSFGNFSDRMSQLAQIMIARKMGKVSLQISPTYLHTNYVISGDQKNIFSLGGAIRLPLSQSVSIISDYFHPFRSAASKNAVEAAQNIKLSDAFGIGVEILTPGHVFHLNFTNATNILENRYLSRTFTSWRDGEFRWGFTIVRNFVVFTDKRKRK